jgi:hypothetical protein
VSFGVRRDQHAVQRLCPTQPRRHRSVHGRRTLRALDVVVDHYRHGVQLSATVSPPLVSPDGRPGIAIDDAEARALVAFLHTLTDSMLDAGG